MERASAAALASIRNDVWLAWARAAAAARSHASDAITTAISSSDHSLGACVTKNPRSGETSSVRTILLAPKETTASRSGQELAPHASAAAVLPARVLSANHTWTGMWRWIGSGGALQRSKSASSEEICATRKEEDSPKHTSTTTTDTRTGCIIRIAIVKKGLTQQTSIVFLWSSVSSAPSRVVTPAQGFGIRSEKLRSQF